MCHHPSASVIVIGLWFATGTEASVDGVADIIDVDFDAAI